MKIIYHLLLLFVLHFSFLTPAQAFFKENSELNVKAYELALEFGGAEYSENLNIVIPHDSDEIKKEWIKSKEKISKRIGTITPKPSLKSAQWENTARTIQELQRDAKTMAPHFKEITQNIAKLTKTQAFFGINDSQLVKNKKSLTRKVEQESYYLGISKEQTVAKIRDALRSTIIVENPEQIASIVEAIKNEVRKEEAEVIFHNYWIEERETGYVGVHAKILLPVSSNQSKEKRYIISEIQIHLRTISDESKSSIKETAHQLYEKLRDDNEEESKFRKSLSSSSMLLYLIGIKNAANHDALLHE